ncbi:MAG TPA: ankyrin repeat domain-containing protein [Candidatus Solibacter sp.]|nr:ankyrin repeat domain-containing protein [Candidatus Solibacter sp.]
MPVKPLPPNPDLNQLKYQAKDLRKAHAARDRAAAQRLREFHPRMHQASDDEIFEAKLSLSDAQLAIARERGFPSWARLKRRVEKPKPADRLDLPHHERIEDADFRRAVDLIDAGDVAGLRAHLKQHPKLSRQHVIFEGMNYFHNPSLLEFVAENPIRRGELPANIVDVARVILEDAVLNGGVERKSLQDALALSATGSVPQQCGVQNGLIELFCDYGADPQSELQAAALHGSLGAVATLLSRGAKLDMPVAAALGRIDDVRRMLSSAGADERHLTFAMSTQYGRIEIVRLLLDAGEDPNRYNPVRGHSHSTPLHQAAGYGPMELVQLLVERGARPNIKDIMWQGTPADWARHMGRTEIEKYLREKEV